MCVEVTFIQDRVKNRMKISCVVSAVEPVVGWTDATSH